MTTTDQARAERHATLVNLGARAARAQHSDDPGLLSGVLRDIAHELRGMAEQEAAARAETTTATTEDADLRAIEGMGGALIPNGDWYAEEIPALFDGIEAAQRLRNRLLATARTSPTREQVQATVRMVLVDAPDASADTISSNVTRAVMALYGQQPETITEWGVRFGAREPDAVPLFFSSEEQARRVSSKAPGRTLMRREVTAWTEAVQ